MGKEISLLKLEIYTAVFHEVKRATRFELVAMLDGERG